MEEVSKVPCKSKVAKIQVVLENGVVISLQKMFPVVSLRSGDNMQIDEDNRGGFLVSYGYGESPNTFFHVAKEEVTPPPQS